MGEMRREVSICIHRHAHMHTYIHIHRHAHRHSCTPACAHAFIFTGMRNRVFMCMYMLACSRRPVVSVSLVSHARLSKNLLKATNADPKNARSSARSSRHTRCFFARATTLIALVLFEGALREANAIFSEVPAGNAFVFTITGTVTSCVMVWSGVADNMAARRFRSI